MGLPDDEGSLFRVGDDEFEPVSAAPDDEFEPVAPKKKPDFKARLASAQTARIPETSQKFWDPHTGVEAIDEYIGEQNPMGVRPSIIPKTIEYGMRSLDEYLTPISGPDEPQAKPAHIPFTKLAGPLAGSPWSPLHGVASALAKTKIGRGAVKGAGIDVPQGQAPSGEDLARVPLSILEDFTTPGNAALLAASMVPGVAVGRLAAAKRLSSPLGVLAQGAHAVGHTAGAALIPGMAVTAADDLGNLGSALITGDMERVGEIAPHAAVNAGMLGMVGHGLAGKKAPAAPAAPRTVEAPAPVVEAAPAEPQPSVRTRLVRDGNGGWVVQPDSPAETVRVAMQRGPGGQVIPVSAETGMPLDPRHTPPALPELPDFTTPLPQALGPRDIPPGRPGLDFPANAPPEVAANQAPRPGSGARKRMNAERDLWDEFQGQQAEAAAPPPVQAEIPQNAPDSEELAGMQPASFPVPPDVAAAAGEPRPSRRDARAAAMAAMVPEGLDTTYPAPARTPADIVLEAVGKTPPPAGGPVKSTASRLHDALAEIRDRHAAEAAAAAASRPSAQAPPTLEQVQRELQEAQQENARLRAMVDPPITTDIHPRWAEGADAEPGGAGEGGGRVLDLSPDIPGLPDQGPLAERLANLPPVARRGLAKLLAEMQGQGTDVRWFDESTGDTGPPITSASGAPEMGSAAGRVLEFSRSRDAASPPPAEAPSPAPPPQGAAPGDIVRRWRQERGEPVTGENIPPDPADVVLRRFMQEREQQRPPTTDPRARAIMERLRRPTMAPPPEGPVGPFRSEVMTPEEAWQETQRANLEKDRAQATPVDPSKKYLDAMPDREQAELLRAKRDVLRQLEDPAMAESRGDLKNVLAEINSRLYPDAEAQLEEIRSRPPTYRQMPEQPAAARIREAIRARERAEAAGAELPLDTPEHASINLRDAVASLPKGTDVDAWLREAANDPDVGAEAQAILNERAAAEGRPQTVSPEMNWNESNPISKAVARFKKEGWAPERIDEFLAQAAEDPEFAPYARWEMEKRAWEKRAPITGEDQLTPEEMDARIARALPAEGEAPTVGAGEPPLPTFEDTPIGDTRARDFARSGASDPEFQEYQRLLAENERLRAEAAPAEPLSPRDQAVVDAAKRRKPTMTTGMGLGALGEEPGKVISDAAKTVLRNAKAAKDWMLEPRDPTERNALAIEQARRTVLDDLRDRGIRSLWDDPRNLMKTGELGKERGLTEAERALDDYYVSGQRKPGEKKTTNQKLLSIYQDAAGFAEPTRALEEIIGDTRPESARASGTLFLPGHRGIYEDMIRHDLREALEPIKGMDASIDKLDRYLGSKKLLEKYNDLQRQHTESEAARAKVSAYEADKSNPKPTAREESLAARETSAPSFEDLAGEGYTMEKARAVVETVDPRVARAAENLGEIGRRQLQRMVDAGAISQETADKLNALYSTNAPLYRDIGGDGPAATGSRPLRSGNLLKRLKGSDRKINSPFYNWLDHQAAIERTIYLNKAKKTMLEPLIDNPEMRKAAEESGMVTFETPDAAVDARFEERAARIKDLAKKLNIELNPEELELFSEMNDSAAGRQLPLHNQVLETRIGGKIVRARVSEDLAKVYESLSSTMGHHDNIASVIGAFMRGSARLMHGAITSLPEFAARQFLPDAATALIYGEKSRGPRRIGYIEAFNAARGATADAAKVEKLGYDPAAEMRGYAQTGAGMANFYGAKGQRALVREAMTPKGKGPFYFTSIPDFLARGYDVLRAAEQVPTVRDYLQRRIAGDVTQDAAYNAVKTTRPNFAMYGASPIVRALRSWTPFAGSSINGLDFTFRRLGGAELLKNMATEKTLGGALKKTQLNKDVQKRQLKVFAGGVAAVAAPTAMAYLIAKATDDQEILGEMRSPIGRDHVIFRPWEGAEIVRIRMPETIGQVFNMYPWLDAAFKGSDDYGQRWIEGIGAKAYTNMMPPPLQVALAWGTNRAAYDWSRPLVSPNQENKAGHLQANRGDSALARGLGTDLLPAPKIDEALGIFGLKPWVEGPTLRPIGNAIARARGFDMGELPAASWADYSPLRGFLHHTSRDTYSQGRFYRNLHAAKKEKGSYDAVAGGEVPLTPERRIDEMAEHRPDDAALEAMMEKSRQISELRKQQTKVMVSKVYDAEMKRDLMDELQDRMNRLARQSNEQEMMRRAARSSFR